VLERHEREARAVCRQLQRTHRVASVPPERADSRVLACPTYEVQHMRRLAVCEAGKRRVSNRQAQRSARLAAAQLAWRGRWASPLVPSSLLRTWLWEPRLGLHLPSFVSGGMQQMRNGRARLESDGQMGGVFVDSHCPSLQEAARQSPHTMCMSPATLTAGTYLILLVTRAASWVEC